MSYSKCVQCNRPSCHYCECPELRPAMLDKYEAKNGHKHRCRACMDRNLLTKIAEMLVGFDADEDAGDDAEETAP